VGAATFAVLGVGSASFAAGGSQNRLPEVSPSLDQFAVEHALTSGDVPTNPLSATTPPTTRPSVVPERAGTHLQHVGAGDQRKGTAKP
jgi:phytoene dehydrogenase-like protein